MASLDRVGRIQAQPDLTVAGHPEVFAIGDMTAAPADGEFLPGVAPVAMQEGRHVASTIRVRLDGTTVSRRFQYRDRGHLATIGRGAAIARVGPLSFDGFLAWVIWLFVHIMYIVEFQARLVVVARWA